MLICLKLIAQLGSRTISTVKSRKLDLNSSSVVQSLLHTSGICPNQIICCQSVYFEPSQVSIIDVSNFQLLLSEIYISIELSWVRDFFHVNSILCWVYSLYFIRRKIHISKISLTFCKIASCGACFRISFL